ncbi:ABC transporter ATP-binding [Babesia ovis]|uniref:ABC transporter ATP-binding n=3 Tax=Babesia ovis TaxID=5869 RepID=A0A9W5TAN3_BABOV|nr:ABC transporter ATP-binding [Babesia ovis]
MLLFTTSSCLFYSHVFWILFCGFLFNTLALALFSDRNSTNWTSSRGRDCTKQNAFLFYPYASSHKRRVIPVVYSNGPTQDNEAVLKDSQSRERERNLALCVPKVENNITKHFDAVKESGTVIEVSNLTIWVGDRVLFDNVGFRINRGDCVGIIGNNGNGKTSLLDAVYHRLSGVDPPITTLSASMDIKHISSQPHTINKSKLAAYQILYYLRVRGHNLRDISHIPLGDILKSEDYSRFLLSDNIFKSDTSFNNEVAYMRQNYVSQLDNSMLVEQVINNANSIHHARMSIIQDIEDNLDYLNSMIDDLDSAPIMERSFTISSNVDWTKEVLSLYNSENHSVREMCKDVDIRTTSLVDMFGLRDTLPLRVGELSGGFKMRLHLLTQLINRPRLLFLDEPTNNLDMASVMFLSTILKRLIETSGLSVLLISHNSDFLNQLCTSIIQVPGDGTLAVYSGDFDKFVERGSTILQSKTSRLQNLEANLKKLQQQYQIQSESTKGSQKQKRVLLSQKRQLIEETENLVDQIKGAKKSAYSNVYEKSLLLSADSSNINEFTHLNLVKRGIFVFPDTPAFNLQDVVLCNKANEVLLSNVSLTIHNGDRILLLGNNGAGKSTLLSVLNAAARAANMGIEDVNMILYPESHSHIESGYCKGKRNTIINNFSQNCSELLNSTSTVDALAMKYADLDLSHMEQLTKYLTSFHLQDFIDVNVCDLSFGERSRLLLALQFLRDSTFLFLDEPSNHLDIYMQKTLSHLLNNVYTKGGIVVATHDLHLLQSLERITGVVYIHDRDKVYTFNGAFKDVYLSLRKEKPNISHEDMGNFLENCKIPYKRDTHLFAMDPYSVPEATGVKRKGPKGRKSVSRAPNTPGRAKIKNAKRYT